MTPVEWVLIGLVSVLSIGGGVALWLHHDRENEIAEAQVLRDAQHERNAVDRERRADERFERMQASLAEGTKAMAEHARAAAVSSAQVAKAHNELLGDGHLSAKPRPAGVSILQDLDKRVTDLERWRDATDPDAK